MVRVEASEGMAGRVEQGGTGAGQAGRGKAGQDVAGQSYTAVRNEGNSRQTSISLRTGADIRTDP